MLTITLTNDQRRALIAELGSYSDADAYVSDMALSSIWGEEDGDIPAERIAYLRTLYRAMHGDLSVKDIAADAGMSLRRLAETFGVPYRTMENWTEGRSSPPPYVLAMMAELVSSS